VVVAGKRSDWIGGFDLWHGIGSPDLLGGVAAGILLTFVQSLHWIGAKARMLVHGAAMVIVFSVSMLEMCNTIRMDGWGLSIFYAVVLTLFASLIIALIDYQANVPGFGSG
jgi:hypothetical protein